MGSHEKDHHKFQYSVEDEDKTGSKNELLLQVEGRRDKATDKITLGRVRNGHPVKMCEAQITSPSGQVFLGKGHNSNEHVDFERQGYSTSKLSYLQQEIGLEPNSCSIGLCSSTTSKQYSCKEAIILCKNIVWKLCWSKVQ